MVRTPKYELIQERLGRPLSGQLRFWRAARLSAPAIARLIFNETRVRVTGETIRQWLRALEEANGEAA